MAHRWVYFIQDRDRTKIGFSDDPENNRLKKMQKLSSHPELVKLVHKVPGARPLEQELHEHLSDHRLHGEWFDLVAEADGWQRTVDEVRALGGGLSKSRRAVIQAGLRADLFENTPSAKERFLSALDGARPLANTSAQQGWIEKMEREFATGTWDADEDGPLPKTAPPSPDPGKNKHLYRCNVCKRGPMAAGPLKQHQAATGHEGRTACSPSMRRATKEGSILSPNGRRKKSDDVVFPGGRRDREDAVWV